MSYISFRPLARIVGVLTFAGLRDSLIEELRFRPLARIVGVLTCRFFSLKYDKTTFPSPREDCGGSN